MLLTQYHSFMCAPASMHIVATLMSNNFCCCCYSHSYSYSCCCCCCCWWLWWWWCYRYQYMNDAPVGFRQSSILGCMMVSAINCRYSTSKPHTHPKWNLPCTPAQHPLHLHQLETLLVH